jgi:VCBS repeat protein
MWTSRILWITRCVVVAGLWSLAWESLVWAETQLDFIARRNFRVEGAVVAVGDFNGDRHQDSVTARSGTVSILPANRDGSLQAPRDVRVGGAPSAATIGDFNGDGLQDLATANSDSGTVSIVLGRVDSSFRPARNFRVGGLPNSIAVGDFNGDGRQDLVTANGDSGVVSVLLGLGNGGFRTARDLAVGTSPYQVTVGDFNGDGRHDLAVANSGPNTISVLLGKGNGTFQLARDTDSGEVRPSSITVGDFNGDGRQDLAVSGDWSDESQGIYFSGITSILLATGNGTFQVTTATNFGGLGVKTGDFNGDAQLDLAVAWAVDADPYTFESGLTILLGQGDGTFRSKWGSGLGWGSPFTFGDFDADGRQDLALDTGLGTVSILVGDGDGSFQDAVNLGIGAYVVRVGDLNGDGRQDLAMTNFSGLCNEGGCNGEESVSVLLGRGDGTFETAQHYSRGCPFGIGTCPADFDIGDFNGDGRQDLVLLSGNSVSIQLSKPDGSLLSPKGFKWEGYQSPLPWEILMATAARIWP